MKCRAYYRCTDQHCNIRKQVERDVPNFKYAIVSYEERHNYEVPSKQRNLAFSINVIAIRVSENVGTPPSPLALPDW
jgi:hypothetical protein